MLILKDLLYTKDHDWVKVEGNKAYLGITDFAQKALGTIVYVELPEVGAEFSEGDAFAVIESVKAASDIFAPLDLIVLEVNEEVTNEPSLINQDCYKNWMALIKLPDTSKLQDFLSSSDYEELCKREA